MTQLLITHIDGDLYDTSANWSCVRRNYQRHHTTMRSLADVKATIRAGDTAWPGCYPLYFLVDDGAALCFECARSEFRLVAGDWHFNTPTGWRIIYCEANYEDAELACDHCNNKIRSAFAA